MHSWGKGGGDGAVTPPKKIKDERGQKNDITWGKINHATSICTKCIPLDDYTSHSRDEYY